MPLMKSKSKKAFSHNIKAEMEAGKPQKQSIAIAYSVKRKAPKKYAKGGQIPPSAKTEPRPMPDQASEGESRNMGNKPPKEDSWTSRPDIKQTTRGTKTTAIKHPKMVPINGANLRLRDEEDDLQSSAGVNDGPQEQPPKADDEMDAKKSGDEVPDMQREHSNGRKPYAAGGKVIDEDAMDLRLRDDESDLMIHDDPSEDEGDADAHSLDEVDGNRQGPKVPDMEDEHSNGRKPYAEGGLAHEMDDQDTSEMEEEHHSSIADAIMANRERMHAEIDSGSRDLDAAARYASGGTVESGSRDMNMYEGGQVPNHDDGEADVMLNGEEHSNGYYPRNEDEVLKENYMDDMEDVSQPEDSNETGDERESMRSDKHDMVDKIMKKRKQKQG
jgi:hypothetical protein